MYMGTMGSHRSICVIEILAGLYRTFDHSDHDTKVQYYKTLLSDIKTHDSPESRRHLPLLFLNFLSQHHEDELQDQINQMDRIYQYATCTLVAVEGHDSNHGLPGATLPRS